jgi:hypothetical protein
MALPAARLAPIDRKRFDRPPLTATRANPRLVTAADPALTRYRRALERRHIFGAGLAAEETAHPRWLGAGRIADPVRRTFSICSV